MRKGYVGKGGEGGGGGGWERERPQKVQRMAWQIGDIEREM